MLVPVVSSAVFSGSVMWWKSICSLLLWCAEIVIKRLHLLSNLYDHMHVQHQTASDVCAQHVATSSSARSLSPLCVWISTFVNRSGCPSQHLLHPDGVIWLWMQWRRTRGERLSTGTDWTWKRNKVGQKRNEGSLTSWWGSYQPRAEMVFHLPYVRMWAQRIDVRGGGLASFFVQVPICPFGFQPCPSFIIISRCFPFCFTH